MRKNIIGLGFGILLIALVYLWQTTPTWATKLNQPVLVLQTQSEQTAKSSNVAPKSDMLLVRPRGAPGELIAYDLADRQVRFRLPPGRLSADGKHYFAATQFGDETRFKEFDPLTGQLRMEYQIRDQWIVGGVSLQGNWIALTKANGSKTNTNIVVVYMVDGKIIHSLNLDGNFEVEAISADGNSLFLIQYLSAKSSERYAIRLYDLARGELVPGALRAKGEPEEMVGIAYNQVASPDGRWLLTLYLDTQNKLAFIHTLDLQDKFAHCVDLPSGDGDLDLLKYYTLSLSPDGSKVYAVNAALGIVAEVDLDSRRVIRAVEFDRRPVAAADDPQAQFSHSIVSGDGQTLYFANGNDVWAYDTLSGKVGERYTADAPIVGLGLSGDGKRLYIAHADQSLRMFDSLTSRGR